MDSWTCGLVDLVLTSPIIPAVWDLVQTKLKTPAGSAAVTVGIPTHGFPHTRAPRSCVSLCRILLQRHYRGRQLVLSGQLRPFISLPGTAVIKQNKETGSNSRVKERKKNHSSVRLAFFSWLFPLPVSVAAASSGEPEEADL